MLKLVTEKIRKITQKHVSLKSKIIQINSKKKCFLMVQKVACANGKGIKETSKMRPKFIGNSMKIATKILFFSRRFLDLLFLIFLIFFKTGRFWNPLENPMGSKMVPKSSNGAKMLKTNSTRSPPLAFQILFRFRDQFLMDLWSTCGHFLQFLESTPIDFG